VLRRYNTGVAKIVVGIDGSDSSKDALGWAVEEARLRRAEVVAVHAWEAPPPVPELGPGPAVDVVAILPQLEEAAAKVAASIVAEVVGDDPDVKVEPVALEGPAAAVLIDSAADAEMIVVGSRGRGGFVSLVLGSVSHQVATHAPCPVLIHRSRQ
jgi:nucleotide-binding universal stress UspA family protein